MITHLRQWTRREKNPGNDNICNKQTRKKCKDQKIWMNHWKSKCIDSRVFVSISCKIIVTEILLFEPVRLGWDCGRNWWMLRGDWCLLCVRSSCTLCTLGVREPGRESIRLRWSSFLFMKRGLCARLQIQNSVTILKSIWIGTMFAIVCGRIFNILPLLAIRRKLRSRMAKCHIFDWGTAASFNEAWCWLTPSHCDWNETMQSMISFVVVVHSSIWFD